MQALPRDRDRRVNRPVRVCDMEELFGLSMNVIMVFLLAIFLVGMVIIAGAALRNRIMLKLGLRNIPRRRAQTVLIIVGIMLSTVITTAAFGTGDTLSYSIRNLAVTGLRTVDEVIIPARAGAEDNLRRAPYIPQERFLQLQRQIADLESIDGFMPVIDEEVPTVNPRTSLSEGSMRMVGLDPALLQGFGNFESTSGEEVLLDDLGPDDVYLTDKGAEELDTVAGDQLHLFIRDNRVTINVREVIKHDGLAGTDPTILLPLDRAQRIFDRPGQINIIVVSNLGGVREGAELSKEVTRELRILLTDREVADQLKGLLNQDAVLKALQEKEESLDRDDGQDLSHLRTELQREELSDELISLLSDRDVTDLVEETLDEDGLQEVQREASTLVAELAEFRVLELKRIALKVADEVGTGVTTLFITMGLFSILVGVLLIFLIFVMLAAARKSEMGMARAVGARRGHLVQMFVFEGTAYALVAAAVGVLLGLAVSALMVGIMNWIISQFDVDFRLTIHFEPRSVIVAYCLGMVITFATIAVSAYRVSRLNIVVAIRGLPETLLPSGEPPISARLLGVPKAVVRPINFLVRGIMSLPRRRFTSFLGYLGLAALWVIIFPVWIIDVVVAVFRFIWPYLLRGWLTSVIGALIVWLGISQGRDSIFYAGGSLVIIGLGLLGRKALQRTTLRPEVRDRIAFTLMGLVMLAFWALPPDTFEGLTGHLEGDFEMMFVSGVFMVTAAVWTVMYNAGLLLRAFTLILGRVGRLRPVLVTAVAYPMSAKFRTGLTLAMFSLVMFTVVVMSVIVDSFGTSITSDVDLVTGGWDIEGDVNFNTPIQDIRQAIENQPKLNIDDFQSIGGYTTVRIDARQVGTSQQRWRGYRIWAADDDYLANSGYRLKLIADGYGPGEVQVWEALKNDPSLTVVEGSVVPTREGDEDGSEFFEIEGVFYEDEKMSPVDIEIREPLTGVIFPLKVIGVMDRVHDPFEEWRGMLTSKSALDQAIPFPVPTSTYAFMVGDGMDQDRVSKDLEASFRENGMETSVLEDDIKRGVAGIRSFYYLLIGFMALGLVVGIAGLGVVSTRAVVERRQQIGVLRAIGYRRRMIELSFLLESSFVSLLGIGIGVGLGTMLSYNAISDIRAEEGIDTLRYSVPWLQIMAIVAVAYVFSLAATLLPARQASRIYPAEALRYE